MSNKIGDFKVVTTPTVPGYRITRVIGLANGLSPRTRDVGGVIVGALQSIGGGEISAFTSEIEKARAEAITRAIQQARNNGANAIVSLDLETSNVGEGFITLISATGTAVVIEKEN